MSSIGQAANAPPEKQRNLLVRLIKILNKNTNAIPYSSVTSADPGLSFPDGFLVSDYKGLLSCHIVKGEGKDQLVNYWIDEDHYKASGDILRNKLKLSLPSPPYSGKVIEVKCPRGSLWKRYPIGTTILTIAAVFGALSAIRDYFGVLFAAPQVELSYSALGKLDVIENTQISVPLTAVSEVRFAPTQISIDSVALQPTNEGQSVSLGADPQVLPSLVPGQSQSIKIEGTAPKVTDPQRSGNYGSPKIYDLSVKATANAGIFRFARHTPVAALTVWVWPLTPKTAIVSMPNRTSNACEMDGNVYISEPGPSGTTAKVEVVLTNRTREPVPTMIVSPPPGVDSPSVLTPSGSNRMQKAEFRIPAPGRFQTYPYKVFLEFPKKVTDHDCQEWLRNTDVSADWAKIDVER
jgi:hypothetical protein